MQVTLAAGEGTDNSDSSLSTRLSAHPSYVLVDGATSNNSDIMLVTDDDNMPTTERLLEELTNSTLSNAP